MCGRWVNGCQTISHPLCWLWKISSGLVGCILIGGATRRTSTLWKPIEPITWSTIWNNSDVVTVRTIRRLMAVSSSILVTNVTFVTGSVVPAMHMVWLIALVNVCRSRACSDQAPLLMLVRCRPRQPDMSAEWSLYSRGSDACKQLPVVIPVVTRCVMIPTILSISHHLASKDPWVDVD